MGALQQIGPAPMPAVARVLSRFDRPQLEAFLSVAIDLLDVMDGDADTEEDDPPGQCDEDEVNTDLAMACGGGPGCAISDQGGDEHDGCEPDEDLVPCFGLDQTAEIVSDYRGLERVPDIPCTPLRFIE